MQMQAETPAPGKPNKASKKVKVKAEPPDASEDARQDSEAILVKEEDVIGSPETVQKPKKKRRGPSGYALIGEGVADTPADRRARLKAAKAAGIKLQH